jgi:GDPmannose 4,6-dehydratase
MKRALITGVTGQDGSYLAELLLEKGYKVFGLIRRSSTSSSNYERIAHLVDDITLVPGDLLDQACLVRALEMAEPDEVYNLAAQSFVATSWDQPALTCDVTAHGVLRVLEAIRIVNTKIKFYQASSSEMFGKASESPQKETTPFHPRSPYAVAKVYGHHITVNYRESYGIFAVSGICFNHESPRRGLEFVTRKISHGVARIKLGLDRQLLMGNLDACRDWGYAKDYVIAMWTMLQQDQPADCVIATGETHSVREFLEAAFSHAGLNYQDCVQIDPAFLRPAEVDRLIGDPSRAKRELNWTPQTSFINLVQMMVESDLRYVRDFEVSRRAHAACTS